jgi:hypothetical protein
VLKGHSHRVEPTDVIGSLAARAVHPLHGPMMSGEHGVIPLGLGSSYHGSLRGDQFRLNAGHPFELR